MSCFQIIPVALNTRLRVNAFCDYMTPHLNAHVYDRSNYQRCLIVLVTIFDEGSVDFDFVKRESNQR